MRRLLSFVASAVMVNAAGVKAQVCEPTVDGFACVPVACSPIPEDECIATVLHLDISSGAITAVVCTCMDFNDCHVEFGDATPRGVGKCPADQTCQVFGQDTNGDGIEDQFGADCVSLVTGACCVDVDDGPISYDTCMEVSQSSCEANGGIFHGANTACTVVQACCLSFVGKSFCAEMNPFCCFDSGGLPKDPGITCDDPVSKGGCGAVCGGLVGIPCEAGEFCKLRRGECCCDFQGFCTAIPEACPGVWDPVCGCDGQTYGNECEADMGSVSTMRLGQCDSTCCDPRTKPPSFEPVWCCVNGAWLPDDGDGNPDCVLGEVCGACCSDIGGSPLPVPVCDDGLLKNQCTTGSITAFFKGSGTTCEPFEACCLSEALGSLVDGCADLEPFCCVSFGGKPLGPGTSCYPDPIACGGIAGLPCPAEYDCVDDPSDNCDPKLGGADCIGICVPPKVCGGPLGILCPEGFHCVSDQGEDCDPATGPPDCVGVCVPISPCPKNQKCVTDGDCPAVSEFCKFPTGSCGSAAGDVGVCTEHPDACPAVWDPVCGCDGVTYGNECEADAAGVSTDRPGKCGSVCDERPDEPCVKVVVDMDSLTPGFQSNVNVPAGTTVVEDVAVYIFDPAEQHAIWGIGVVGLENRSIALGHMPNDAENQGSVVGLAATVGVPVNPGNSSWTAGSPGLLRAFAGPEVHYVEWGAQQPSVIPATPAGPVFTVDIMLEGAQTGDTFDFFLVDFFAVIEQVGGAFCTQGPLSLDTGGDAVPDGTQTLHGADADVPVEVPPGAFYVDYVDGGVHGAATITVIEQVRAVPAISDWGLMVLGLLVLTAGPVIVASRRRRKT